ncbi:MAG: PDDEXK nuclease domain-containing protein [Elusimicrobia bacterium]|nr:PDDEXK nuclease domain-containing protein [Candidatus Obscuribacterium magneticum]
MNKRKPSEREKHTGMKSAVIAGADYDQFLSALKIRIQAARLSAARAVNRDLILLYWDIGRAIVEKQALLNWGDSVVEMVAKDLQREFPAMAGFSPANVWRMRQLHTVYSSEAILAQAARELENRSPRQGVPSFLEQVVPERKTVPVATEGSPILAQAVRELAAAVPWGHHVLLLGKTKSAPELLYYLRATARFGWARNVLLNQIKAGAYERAVTEKKTHNFPLALPEFLAEQAEEALKSRYNLEFLGIRRAIKERQLEDRLLERLREFILELGYGFCFVGRQHRLVLGQKEYFIDLLFYHRFIKALVAFELKVGPFEPEYAGKMDFYLNLLNEKERAPDDHPSIGIILCAEKDNLEVEFSLKSKTNPIGVAEYHLQSKLPPELKGKLPTARQLRDVIRPILPTGR